ncbi:MAG: hypothetical protein KGZ40_08725, partial [Clostridiales bacterium]|nr:hypothetical protein [Clostridiales bacterium]
PASAETGRALPSGFTVHDDETVYVVADASGVPRETVVIDWLRVDGDGTVEVFDPGTVTSPEALEDSLEPRVSTDGVTWTLDVNSRRDFFYRATTQEQLPIEIDAVYYLDGRRTTPGDLAGASGRVRIEVTVTNRLRVEEEVTYTGADGLIRSGQAEYWVPMLAPVMIEVDGTRFTDIVADAEIVSVSGSTVSHTFMAFPQPETTVVIEMTGDDIEIEPIVVSVFPKMAGSPDFSVTDQLAELRDGLGGLKQLSEGHHHILGGMADGIDPAQYAGIGDAAAGFERLAAGSRDLGAGVSGLANLLDAQIAYLNSVIAQLRGHDHRPIAEIPAAIKALGGDVRETKADVDGMVELLDGQIAYLDAIAASNAGLETSAWALADASADTTHTAAAVEIATGLSAQSQMLTALRDGDDAMGMPLGLTGTRSALTELSSSLTRIADSLDALAAGTAPLIALPGQFNSLAVALETLRDGGPVPGGQRMPGLTASRDGLADAARGLEGVSSGIVLAADALEPLEELPGMLGQLRDALLAVRDGGTLAGAKVPGVSTTTLALSEISTKLGEGIDESNLGEVVVSRMEEAAEAYDTFLGKPDGATGDVRFIFKLDGIAADGE